MGHLASVAGFTESIFMYKFKKLVIMTGMHAFVAEPIMYLCTIFYQRQGSKGIRLLYIQVSKKQT